MHNMVYNKFVISKEHPKGIMVEVAEELPTAKEPKCIDMSKIVAKMIAKGIISSKEEVES